MVDFTTSVDESTARAAAKTWFVHMFRTYRVRMFAFSITFLAIVTIAGFVYDGLSWFSGLFAAVLFLNILHFPIFYFGFQNAAAKAARTTPQAEYRVTDTEITCTTPKHTLSIPLAELHALLANEKSWIVVFSRYGYWCLPKSQTPDQAVAAIQSARSNNSFKPNPLRGSA